MFEFNQLEKVYLRSVFCTNMNCVDFILIFKLRPEKKISTLHWPTKSDCKPGELKIYFWLLLNFYVATCATVLVWIGRTTEGGTCLL